MIVHVFDRHLFYLSVCESFLSGKLRITDRQLTAQIVSLIIHAEMKVEQNIHQVLLRYQDYLPEASPWRGDSELRWLIFPELEKLDGVSKAVAEYRLIQMVDSLLLYGASYHTARNSVGTSLNIAVTSSGIVFFSEDWNELKRSEPIVSF